MKGPSIAAHALGVAVVLWLATPPTSAVALRAQDTAGANPGGAPTEEILAWSVKEIWTIAAHDIGGGASSETQSFRVVAHPEAGIFLLHPGKPAVYRISPAGEIVDTLHGSSELVAPVGLAIDKSGNVGVFDRRRGTIKRWFPDGTLAAEWRPDSFILGPDIALAAQGLVFRGIQESPLGFDPYTLRWVPEHGEPSVLFTGAPVLWRTADFPACGAGQITVSPLFSFDLPWSAHGNTIAVADYRGYRVLILRGDSVIREIRREMPTRPVTREMALRELASGWKVNGCQVGPEALDQIGFETSLPAIGALRISPAGELWVSRGRVADEEPVIDVFSPEGDFIGTLPAGIPFPDAFVDGDSYLVLAKTMGGWQLDAYRLTRD